MSELSREDRIVLLHERIELIIERNGWAVQGVFDPEDKVETFSYTVGLERKGLPELVMVGLPPELACTLLNDAARQMIARQAFQPGERISGVVKDFDLLAAEVSDSRVQLTMANAHALLAAGDEPIAALQLYWPDPKGRFPAELEYDHPCRQVLPD